LNTSSSDTGATLPETAAALSPLLDEATERGLKELLEKVAPLIQGRRFHNVVDLLSLASDGVDMFDDAMVQKLMKAYEESIGTAWALRTAGNEDVRRGLHFALQFLAVLGRQMNHDVEE
jgi:uncharacterized protein YjgD (DUF1641 family)